MKLKICVNKPFLSTCLSVTVMTTLQPVTRKQCCINDKCDYKTNLPVCVRWVVVVVVGQRRERQFTNQQWSGGAKEGKNKEEEGEESGRVKTPSVLNH